MLDAEPDAAGAPHSIGLVGTETAPVASGMTMSCPAAGDLLDERVECVANQMRVTPATARKYLIEETLAGIAREIVFGFVEETPGADLISAPRT